jgi:aminomethyltransferase
MPRPSPFHSRTSALCESHSWIDWSGFLSANSYELDHVHEYNAVRTSCGLFDISPLFKYRLQGSGALALLNRIATRDISKCRIGQAMYTVWCDDQGKIIDDGTVVRTGDDSYQLTAAIPTFCWLDDNALGLDVAIEDATHLLGGLSLQGPTSRDLLQELARTDLSSLKYFHAIQDEIAGLPVWISRTGYTGDLGFEIFVDSGNAEALWDAIYEIGHRYGMQPAGNTALEMLRIEAGLLLIDVDFTSAKQTIFEVEKTTPYELGLGWAVHLEKDYFIGRDALRAEKPREPDWETVGLQLDIEALEKIYAKFGMPLHLPYTAWTGAVPIYADEDRRRYIGKATSGAWSPILKKYIAIARVKPPDVSGDSRIFVEVTVASRRFAIPAKVVKRPFFDPPRKKG